MEKRGNSTKDTVMMQLHHKDTIFHFIERKNWYLEYSSFTNILETQALLFLV